MSASSPAKPQLNPYLTDLDDTSSREISPAWALMQKILAPLASLKLTVALLFLGVIVIFIGTLAQTKADIWEVMRDYFRAWVMYVPLAIFFPPSFFPNLTPPSGGFYFFGGATIGSLMFLNLIAAHLVRFKAQPWTLKSAWGWLVFALGVALTLVVVVSGSSSSGVQDKPWIPWSVMWYGYLTSVVAICGASWVTAVYALNSAKQTRATLALSLGAATVAVAATCGLAFIALWPEQARLGESSLRIVWQLMQGGVSGLLLMAGSWLVFGRRAGIVVIHGGIALLMTGEALVSWYAVETQMNIREGATTNFARDIRTTELAFIDSSDATFDEVTVVPLSQLARSEERKEEITNVRLPVNVRVVKYLRNAELRRIKPGDENPATAGSGLEWFADVRKAGTGTDADSKVDMSAAYVALTDPRTKRELGTYLVSIIGTEVGEPERIEIDGKKYSVALRFKHYNKPYRVKLEEVRQDTYVGTNTPRNYSSDIHLDDPSRKVDLKAHVWMNNPLRYGGETFYQSGYREGPEGKETTLAVVSNTGWMIPYVACMLVAIGMAFHFQFSLDRFLVKSSRPTAKTDLWKPGHAPTTAKTVDLPKKPLADVTPVAVGEWGRASWIAVGVTALLFLLFVGKIATPERAKANDFDLPKFGTTSVVHEGRVKPMDTLARVMLRIVSNQETYKDENGKTQQAIRWMLDLVSGSRQGSDAKVIRIEHPQVLALFGLPDRPGFFRYSIAELGKDGKFKEFAEQVEVAEKKAEKKERMEVYERKILELASRLKAIQQLQAAFGPPPVPRLPTPDKLKEDPEAIGRWRMEFAALYERVADQKSMPLVIPLEAKDPLLLARAKGPAKDGWSSFPTSYLETFLRMRILGEKGDPAVTSFNEILDAYGDGRDAEFQLAEAKAKDKPEDAKLAAERATAVETFARKTVEFQDLAAKRRPSNYHAETLKLEAYFNHVSPFFWGIWMYFVGFLLVSFSWLTGQRKTLGAAAFTMLALTFLFHTGAMLLRMYISGRPPVTNLYSSALFIGLGCVVAGLALETVFGRGFGLLTSSVAGFATLWIALFLSFDGDTMTVLQAVLDTQFWLATHVTCITMGYASTFLAGLLGAVQIARGFTRPKLDDDVSRDLANMTYGTLCFALFYSFVGTVLGGLWADDSWGRFWGWDPKENGALMIVLWNAIILHARWDKMIAARGLAVLAVLGNVVTAWSWFGVNELGVGLHSYGFTEGRLRSLLLVILAHLFVAAIGVIGGVIARATPTERVKAA